MLKALRAEHPVCKLFVREDLSHALVNALQVGELDVLLLALPFPTEHTDTLTLFEDPFYLATLPNSRLALSQKLRTKDLHGAEMLLLEEGHCLRDHALEACKLESADTDLVYQGTSLHTLVQMVANGLGVTLLPAISVAGDVLGDTHLKIKEFNNENVSREIGMSWRKSDPRREEYLLLADFVKENTPGAKPLA